MIKKILLLGIAIVLFFSIAGTPIAQIANAQSNAALSQKHYADDGYLGSGSYLGAVPESTAYAYKSDVEYSLPIGLPTYFDGSGSANSCAVNSGSVIVGYYNNDLNLIPGFQATRTVMGITRWNNQNDLVQDMINRLYSLMKTNPNVGGGTTIENFKSGFSEYANERGYSASITSRMSGSSFNYNQLISSIQNGKPVALFMAGYNVFSVVNTKDNVDTINKGYYSGNHVFSAYGYREIRYYDVNSNLIKHHTYLSIYTSVPDLAHGYVKLNDGCVVDDAYEMLIY